MNKQDAIRKFVEQEFNNIPLSLVEKAYKGEGLFNYIVSPVEPMLEDYELEDDSEPEIPVSEDFEIEQEFVNALAEYEGTHEKWQQYQADYEQYEYKCEDYYPMWGTLFEASGYVAQFVRDNTKAVQDIGFIIFDDFDELELCLGVNGAGYDFYTEHWEKLYDLLNLKWHEQ